MGPRRASGAEKCDELSSGLESSPLANPDPDLLAVSQALAVGDCRCDDVAPFGQRDRQVLTRSQNASDARGPRDIRTHVTVLVVSCRAGQRQRHAVDSARVVHRRYGDVGPTSPARRDR